MRTLLVLLLCSLSSRALAQVDLERAKASWRAGAVAYTAGDYEPAIQAFEAAYAATPLAQIAFSLAQAHRRQYFVAHARPNLERAVELFRRYVQEVEQGGRSADALDALSQLEPLLAAQPATPQAPSVEARPTRLMITSEAAEARISLDGAAAVPSPAIQEVAPGAHRVRVEAAGFTPSERVVTALPGELILSEVELRELPARLVVRSSSDAELYVDGSFVGHGGAHAQLALASGAHTLTITQTGHRIAQRTLTLARGETRELELPLQLTFQRKLARGLFVLGGAGVLAGTACGALALHYQREAQDFLHARERGNVSAAQADEYDRDTRKRDGYRLATGLSLGAAGVVLLAALLTHQLDRPNLGERRVLASADGLLIEF